MAGIRLEDIVDRVQKFNPDADVDLIRRAYIFSAKVHQGQTRMSGESYLVHPIEVAAILAGLKLDATTIAAALLHDTIEDTPTTYEDIKDIFGEDVASLVDGMTKLSRMELQSREQREAENFRKMVVAMSNDIRVVLIKLADRLHNMRTLAFLAPEKQKRIAQETLDIYAPLANRLGMSKIKTELEDISFMYINPDAYHDLLDKISTRRIERESYINELIAIVREQLDLHGFKGEVKGRPKHYYGIWLKMQRQGIAFEDIHDLIAVRIITDTNVNCYAILGLIHSLWTPVPGRFKDYIGVPKSNLYQSLHTTVIGPKGERVEFQLRTDEMHKLAEEGFAAHWRYKERSSISTREERQFAWLRQLLEWQHDLSDAREFMDSVKGDLFPELVYVFTPRGDVKELPRGSTPIDFAYSVHTDIGHQCIGAKVNGKIVPLRHVLRNGDKIEVTTQAGHTPSRDWLKYAKTSKARTRIKAWLKAEERRKSVQLGRELLEKELRKNDLSPSKVIKSDELLKAAAEHSYHTLDDLFAAMGYGKIAAHTIVTQMLPDRPQPETTARKGDKPLAKPSKPSGGGMKISGMDNMMIHLSKCCNPVPGDKVIGFITRGRGVSVHTADCSNVGDLAFDRERLVEVTWGDLQKSEHSVKISVLTEDKQGLLGSVSSMISAAEANITHAEATTSGENRQAVLNFTIEIKDVGHLGRILKGIEGISGVLEVRRVKTA